MSTTAKTTVSSAEALATAEADALRVYRSLHLFRIEIVREGDGWHVNYDLRDPNMLGGGPHYVISADTGEIVSKKYYQ